MKKHFVADTSSDKYEPARKSSRMGSTSFYTPRDEADSDESFTDLQSPSHAPPGYQTSEDQVAKEFVMAAEPAQPQYSDVASKLMAKMGYKKGSGLGKNEQGIVNVIEASKQRGQRGLGLKLKEFEPSDVKWDFLKEDVSSTEAFDWMPVCTRELPKLDTLITWIKQGPKNVDIEKETNFCSPKTVLDVIKCKSVFDELEGEEMRRARTRSNPYETIRGAIFQNRAAMKMANMDAVCDFMFTCPCYSNGSPMVKDNEILYFADICSGPGGFSEYVLWKKKGDSKGFGFTLKGPNDFKLEEFFSAHSEFFEPHYGINGLEGDGDIYRADNQEEFRQFVLRSTGGEGVHFVMADGGFDVEGKENLQEVLSKRLYLCQFMTALSILRNGGHFVCKLFDIFTVYSTGLVYLMWHVFEQVTIFKPVTSRPANSERYIVCKGKKDIDTDLYNYFLEVNLRYSKLGSILSEEDINEVVPLDVLKSDPKFCSYIIRSNEELGKAQCISLIKIQTFTKNSDLYEQRQSDIRTECLKKWQVPDEVRTRPDRSVAPKEKFKALVKNEMDTSYFELGASRLTKMNLTNIHSVYDYKCYISGADKSWYLLGLGKSFVWKWNGLSRSKWMRVDECRVELPRDTVLKVEFVQELRGQGKGQRRVTAVHVVDALVLCGLDIRDLHYNERMKKASKFAKAVTRMTRPDLAPIRTKDIFRFEEIDVILQKMDMRLVKGCVGEKLCYSFDNERCFVPTGVQFIKIVQDPWMMAYSHSQNRKYFFNTTDKQSVFHTPETAIATFKYSCKHSLFWAWEEGVQIIQTQPVKPGTSAINVQDMLTFIKDKIR